MGNTTATHLEKKENMLKKWPYVSPATVLLILLLIVVYGVPFLPGSYYAKTYHILFTAIILASVYVLEKSRKLNFIIAITIVVIKWSILLLTPEWRNISNVPELAFFAYIVGNLLVQIARTTTGKQNVIIDCINGYFLTALVCAILVALTVLFAPGSFNFPNQDKVPLKGMNEYIYHAIVTFTTTGFGDIVPLTPIAKAVSNFTSAAGQLYVAIIIALLIGYHASKFRR
jgi:hypothetical protein